MADDAPAFVRRSKSTTLRARGSSPSVASVPADAATPDSSFADDADEDATAPPLLLATKLRKKHKSRPKSKANLSFGGDEEEDTTDVFQAKKSSLSRKLKLGASKSAIGIPGNLDQPSVTAQTAGPIYSKEYLSELKASTPSTPASRTQTTTTTYDVEMSLDPNELSGAIVIDDDDAKLEEPTVIPAESSIHAAKQKRERLRTTKTTASGEDEFISLSVTRREDTYQGPHPESRLVREDDELGEGDDEYAEFTAAQERIALGKKQKKKELLNRRAAMIDMINDAEEEDEETMEWEREQLRRGGKRDESPVASAPAKQEYRPAPIPMPTPIPSLDAAIARLSQSLSELTVSHSKNTASMAKLADEREAIAEKEKEMRAMVEKAEAKRSWFSAFREWVETVATFLDEKYPLLEKLEDEHVSLLKERYDMISKRRQQDDEDDLALFLGAPPAAAPETEEVDELGRVVPQQNPAIARRERRVQRAARHARHTAGTPSNAAQEVEEGLSTDGSLPPADVEDYRAALAGLAQRTRDVLEDVRAEEFREPRKGIARWFGDWRAKYADSYVGAFGGLGLVSAWEFWVRLEMVGWDPAEDTRTLDSFSWYKSLYDYSRPRTQRAATKSQDSESDDSDVEQQLGPDGDLVSAMLSTAVVPRLCKVIEGGALDPYSARQLRRVIDLAEQVDLSVNRDKFEMLLKSTITPFRAAIDATAGAVTAHLSPMLTHTQRAGFDPAAPAARRRFLTRRLKLVRNLLRWRRFAGERFGVGALVGRVVRECMRPIAEGGWEVGGEEVMRKVEAALPEDLRADVAGGVPMSM